MHPSLDALTSELNTRSAEPHIDGWLGYDFRGKNAIARSLLNLPHEAFFTRRFFYWLPKNGTPVKVVHKIDEPLVEALQGKTLSYASQSELEQTLFSLIGSSQSIAMEYWPHAAIPALSILDAGTKEFIEQTPARITSSWPLIGPILARLSDSQLQTHRKASIILQNAFIKARQHLKRQLSQNISVSETDLQKIVIDEIHRNGAIFDHPPIIAADAHSAIPHFENEPRNAIPIGKESVVLIDAWCKLGSDPHAVYADLTDMIYTGSTPPDELARLYRAAFQAKTKTVEKLQKKGFPTGADLDAYTRKILKEEGVLEYALHRTGHNIYTSVHGPSTNLDCFETVDIRNLYGRHLYSIEPGLYIPGCFGVRLECNVFLDENKKVHIEESSGISKSSLTLL